MNKKDDVTGDKHSFGQVGKHLREAAGEVLAIFKDIKEVALKEEQGSIQDYLEKISKEIDDQIISFEKTNGKCVSGELNVIYEEPASFHIEVDLYFIDANQKWIKKQIPGKSHKMEWFFSPEEADKLRNVKKLSFEYDPPKG